MKTVPKGISVVFHLLLYVGLAVLSAAPVLAQVPVDESGNPITPLEEGAALGDEAQPLLSGPDLEDLVGPIALYPDDLLAIVLPASTYPLQVVQAARFLEQLKTDPSLKPDEEWDDSVTALLNYPEAIELMNEDIDWTWRLGEAVVAQQTDVIAAIEAFRDRAYAAGNLKSDEYQTVSNDDGVIEIEPANEEVIYVPYYEPERVVVYQPQPVYHYYPRAYPLYYYPYPAGYYFGSGFFWGVTTAYTIGWWTDHLHVYHHSYWGHPYYGHHYHNHYYYRRPSLSVYNRYYVYNSHRYSTYRYRDGDYWRPRRTGGSRPGYHSKRVHYYRDRSRDDWRHRGKYRPDNVWNDRNDHRATWTRSQGSNDRAGNNNDRRRPLNDDNGALRRQRNDGSAVQARSRDDAGNRSSGRSNPGERNDRNGSSIQERNVIQFRQRDTGALRTGERRSTGTAQDLSRRPDQRPSFARNSATSGGQAVNRRPSINTTSRPTNTPQRSGTVQSGTRYANRPQSGSQPQRQVAQRNAPTPRAPSRAAPPPSAPRQSAAPASRAESRPARNVTRGSGQRSDARSRRH